MDEVTALLHVHSIVSITVGAAAAAAAACARNQKN
jgi:hypothetical protein